MFRIDIFLILFGFILFINCDEDSRKNGSLIIKDWTKPPIPPKLNLKHSFEEIPANSTFEVECIGNRPIDWVVRDKFKGHEGEIDIKEAFDPDNPDFPYSSKLTLSNAKYMDTTLYTCCYNETTISNSASVYLFVNDDAHLLTPVYQVFQAYSNDVLVLPCRATNTKANVTLWKEVNDEKIMVNMENEVARYDIQRGFIIYRPHVFYDGSFFCKANLNELGDEEFLILHFTSSENDLPRPFIEEENTNNLKLFSSFHLNCIIDIELNGMANLDWEYPGKLKGNSSGRYLVQNATSSNFKYSDTSTTVKRIQRRLTVLDTQKWDDGAYICLAYKYPTTTNTTIMVKVTGDDQDPYINITMNPERKFITIAENETVKMVFELSSSFSKKDLTVQFFLNDKMLSKSRKINITSSFRGGNGSFTYYEILSINKVRRIDSGNYTILVENGEFKASKMIPLFVQVRPRASVGNELGYYNFGQRYTLYCVVDGFPMVAVGWKWRKCHDYNVCAESWTDLNSTASSSEINGTASWENDARVNDTNKMIRYKPQRSLELKATQSGEYLCVGKNKLGDDEKMTKFTVTDVEGGFGITVPSNNIIEGDDVELTCKALLFEFSNISWYVVDKNDDRKPLEFSVNDWEISYGKTNYSWSSRINVTKVNNANETIICVGERLDVLNTTETNYTLVVRPAIEPKFVSNQSIAKLELEVGRPGILNCTSTGVPEPSITWFKNGREVQDSNIISRRKNGQILFISVALKANVEGTYKCLVKNRRGVKERTFNVFVHDNESMSTETIALLVVLPIVCIMLLLVAFFWLRRLRKEREEKAELKALSQELFNKGEIELLNPEMALDDQVELLPYDHRWEFPKERLKMGRILGQGAFGRVVKAEAIGLEDDGSTTVAVKMLKERADKTQRKALVAELKILIHLGKHLNIVNLLGAVTKNMMKGELLVMVEYCRYGNLRNYLLKRKNRFVNQLDPETGQVDPDLVVLPGSPVRTQLAANKGLSNPIYGQKVNYADLMHENHSGNSYNVAVAPNSPDATGGKSAPFRWLSVNEDDDLGELITTCDLLCYAFQVARGMQYLSSRKLLHRDLAARNVLLADDNVVKICDFGLAKDCYNYDTYRIQGNGPLPIKWMALESLSDKVYTIRSDVWSFGILLWEIFTLGGDPYPGIDLDEEFFKRLKGGYRMEKPDYAPNDVYRIMLHCWNSEPENRPDFETLGDLFGDFLQASVKEFYLELDNQYADMNALNKPTDYLAMSDPNYLTMNNDDNRGQTVTYDNINSVRPVDDGPAPLDPMLAVPMIQLEPIGVNYKIHKNKGRPAPETPDADASKRETDYLMMDNTTNETKSFSRQRKGNESLRSDASSGFHSDLDTSAENNAPPSYNLVMSEERIGIEV